MEPKCTAMEDDLTLGGGHTMQYTDHVLWKCTLETYMTPLITKVSPINLIKFKKMEKLFFNIFHDKSFQI